MSLRKFNYLKENVKLYGQILNFMNGCYGYQNKYFETPPLSHIVKTPYFYFMILKIMCRYTKYL